MSAQEKTAGGLSRRNLWAYPVGTVGRDMAGCMFTNYLLTYVLFTKTLTSVQFACISVIMVAARVFDAFNDPIIGGVLSVIVFITSFSTTLQGWAYVAAFGLLYFAYSVVFTMNDIAYWGMVPALARRADDRNRLTSRTVLFAGVGQFLGGIVVPTFTAGSLVIGGNAVTAYRAVVLIVCAAFTATQLITLLVVREPSARDEAPAEKVGIRKAFSTIARNDQLVWCAVVFLIFSVAQTLMGGGLSVTYLYFEFGYNGLLLSIFSILGNVAGAVLMLVFAALSGRFTRAQLMKAGAFGAAAGYLCIMLSGLFIPREMWALKFTMLTVSNLFAFLGQTLVYLIMIICIANTVEYNEWKTGRREEGIVFSVRPFITKLGTALVQLLVLVIYLAVGVRAVTNQISDLENAASQGLITIAEKTERIGAVLASVPSGKSAALLVCMTVIPAALLLAAYFIYRVKYTITEESYEAMVRDIEARRAAKGETAEWKAGKRHWRWAPRPRLRELWPESTFTALRLHSKSTKQRRSTRRITVPPARPGAR